MDILKSGRMSLVYNQRGECDIYYNYEKSLAVRTHVKQVLQAAIRLAWSKAITFDMLWLGLTDDVRTRIVSLRPTTIQNLARWAIVAAT